MSAVSLVTDSATWGSEFVPADLRLIHAEIVAIDIIHIAVSVIIDSVAGDFLFIFPHIGREVRVIVSHTLVHDCHDDGRVTGRKFPCIIDIDVRARHGCIDRLAFLCGMIMPLGCERRVIERSLYVTCGLCRRSRFPGCGFHLVQSFQPVVVLYPFDSVLLREQFHSLTEVRFRSECQCVPPVESETADLAF